MAITPSDFSKIWAANADTPEYTFSEANYLKGWDFVGNLPPTRAMWNAMQKSTDEKMKYVFDNFGAPLTASTVAGMTMQNRVYVYTGSETGYTAGHWYYWNGSAWTDGGVYVSNIVTVDPTLTVQGNAADSRTVGHNFGIIKDSEDDTLKNVTDGHFWRIRPLGYYHMPTYEEVDGVISEKNTNYYGSDYQLAPRNLCLAFSNADARCYLYFYKMENGQLVPDWDVFKFKISDNTLNYIGSTSRNETIIRDIPDDTYFRFRSMVGETELYGWDGEPFECLPIAADAGRPVNNGSSSYILASDGGFGVTLSGDTEFIVSDGTYRITGISAITQEDTYEVVATTNVNNFSFYKMPRGKKYLRLRIINTDVTRVGDLNNHIIAIGKSKLTGATYGRGEALENNAKNYCNIEWVAKKDVQIDNSTPKRYFRTGIKYNGFPYSENWRTPCFVGWHVSLHTALNAMNDADSIFYNQTVGSKKQPYYGNVCSSFGTLIAGWTYPQTNAGFTYDPKCLLSFNATPQTGNLYTSLYHCTFPVRENVCSNDKSIVVYDGATPTSAKLVRRSNLTQSLDKSAYTKAYGKGFWYNAEFEYGYCVNHADAKADLSVVPYLDFTDTALTEGDARPYKGDKCVYTSNETNVFINIKNGANILYLRDPNGIVQTINVTGTQIDVKSYLTIGGIYYVYTNTSATEESFEYVVISDPIVITLDNQGKIVSISGDFWYIVALMYGSALYPDSSLCCVPKLDDYSGWNRDGQYVAEVRAVFVKTTYGAYNIPFTTEEN